MTPDSRAKLLDALLTDPASASAISVQDRATLIVALSAVVLALVSAPEPPGILPRARDAEITTPGRLLDVKEAAERMGVEPRYLYRIASKLPFTRRVGEKTLRFDARGLERWLASRRP